MYVWRQMKDYKGWQIFKMAEDIGTSSYRRYSFKATNGWGNYITAGTIKELKGMIDRF